MLLPAVEVMVGVLQTQTMHLLLKMPMMFELILVEIVVDDEVAVAVDEVAVVVAVVVKAGEVPVLL